MAYEVGATFDDFEVGATSNDFEIGERYNDLEVPFGVSSRLFREELRILDGGRISEDDWMDRLALASAARYGTGTIPSSVTSDLRSTATIALTTNPVHPDYPPTILCGKSSFDKKKGTRQIERLLQDLALRGRRLLYRGIRSWRYVSPVI